MKYLYFLVFTFYSYTSYSQNFLGIKIKEKPAPFEHNIDIKRMKIEPTFDLVNSKVIGKVTHYFKAIRPQVDSIFFQGEKMDYQEVTLSGKKVKYLASDTGIYIYPSKPLTWDQEDSITIKYSCNPRKGIYFIGWNDPTGRCRKQIWTQGEGEDNHHWIPMYDKPNDKMITEMVVSFDSAYKVLSNGTLLTSNKKDGKTYWHYEMQHPHASYLIMLGIGIYDIEQRKSKSGVPVSLYYYPDHKDRVIWSYKYATECIDFLEEQTGIKYPWESYANIPVQDFMYGAMENTTATIFGDFSMTDARAFQDRNYINTDVHELTHQWFGDLITLRNWDHIWLQESFATFYPKLFQRKIYGEDQYEWMRRNEQNAALNASNRNLLPIVHLDSGTERVYSKGSAVLDMLNYVYGEDIYKKVIHHYLTKYQYSNVETNDLIQSYKDVAGISPDWFFDQWIYHGGEPSYSVSYQEVMKEGLYETQIEVDQIQEQNNEVGLFKMPINIEVHYRNGKMNSKQVWIDKITQNISIPNDDNETIAYVLFDPGSYILKKIKFDKSFEELSFQAKQAKHFIDRYDAVVAMRGTDIQKKRAFLIERFSAEKHAAIKSEIVSQLSGDSYPTTIDFLKIAIKDPSAEVRGSVMQNIGSNKKELQDEIETSLLDSSYQNMGMAMDILMAINPDKKSEYLDKTKMYYGLGNRFRIKWLEYLYQIPAKQAEAIKELVDYTSESFEFQTRKNAFESLLRQGYLDQNVVKNSTSATMSSNTRLANPVKEVIKSYCINDNNKTLFKAYWSQQKWEPWQQKIIDSMK